MASAAQLAANRANSKKSTGPRTPEGKQNSRLNAYTEGFCASTWFIPDEDQEEFSALYESLFNEYQPATATEHILVEKMIHNQWNSLRAIRLQSQLLFCHQPLINIPHDLGLLIRYQTSSDRAFRKAHTELLKAQKQRRNEEIGFVPQNTEEDPAEASAETPKEPQKQEKSQTMPKIAEETPVRTPETAKIAA